MEQVNLNAEEMLEHMHEVFHQMFDEASASPDDAAMLFAIVVPRVVEGELTPTSFEAMFFGDNDDNIRQKMIEALQRLIDQLRGAH